MVGHRRLVRVGRRGGSAAVGPHRRHRGGRDGGEIAGRPWVDVYLAFAIRNARHGNPRRLRSCARRLERLLLLLLRLRRRRPHDARLLQRFGRKRRKLAAVGTAGRRRHADDQLFREVLADSGVDNTLGRDFGWRLRIAAAQEAAHAGLRDGCERAGRVRPRSSNEATSRHAKGAVRRSLHLRLTRRRREAAALWLARRV